MTLETLPNDIAALQTALTAERAARQQAEARASGAEAMVAYLKLLIAKMKRERFGQSAERGRKLLDQLDCGGRFAKLGEDITETGGRAAAMESDPDRAREVHLPVLREDHPAARTLSRHRPRAGWGELVGDDPLRQVWRASAAQPAERIVCPGRHRARRVDPGGLGRRLHRELGAARRIDPPSRARRRASARRRHDRAGPGQGQNRNRPTVDPHFREGRLYVRDDRPFAGPDPPAAVFFYSRNRGGEHPSRHLAGYAGILQADAGACPRAGQRPDPGAGFGDLYDARRRPGPITEAACWSHGRRKFFVLADLGKSPLAIAAVRQIDEIFAIEREINGTAAEQRLAVRQDRIRPLVGEFEGWMRAERARLSRHADIAKAMDYMLKRWPAFTRFLDDGRICLSNNAAERALRRIALGRRSWLFAGSDRGGERAAAIYTLIATAKLNGVDPQAWLADVLRRIADHPASRLDELLPWHWKRHEIPAAAA